MSNPAGLRRTDAVDLVPVPILLVDSDVRILDFNLAARRTFGLSEDCMSLRCGEVLRCAHSHDTAEGCGRGPECELCDIRTAVNNCLRGLDTKQKWTRFRFEQPANKLEFELLVSATLFPMPQGNAVLLVIEDFTEISRMRPIIPICASCKRVRQDSNCWQQVESFFTNNTGLRFSHGFCPECLKQLYGS